MKKFLLTALTAIYIITPSIASAGEKPRQSQWKEALEMYRHGMYAKAMGEFLRIDSAGEDLMAKGYAVLCAEKMRIPGYGTLVDNYLEQYPESSLVPGILYQRGLNLFDDGDYENAALYLGLVDSRHLFKDQVAEYTYKRAYSEFGRGDLDEAWRLFSKSERLPYSDYTAPSRYSLGYISYAREQFPEAYSWFVQAAKDPRFTQVANYYMLECRFMQKDYAYVTQNGPVMYESVPDDRKGHLARIISESFLVLGDAPAAKDYYERNLLNKVPKNRSDYFYAGSVLYAVEDYQGAIDNYSLMTERTDSLGQIASYQMGYSYIMTRNKVAAMDAFKAASEADFDRRISEDAYFNYAKLAFDLNGDTSAFYDYLARYPSREKSDDIYSYMAMAALQNHDYEGAVAAYDNIDELDDRMKGNYMKAYYLRAGQLISSGSYRSAIPCLKAAAYYLPRQNPFNQMSRYWTGESYYRDEKYAEARDIFTDLYNISALDSQPEGDLLSYNIAYTYFSENNFQQALKWFRNYLEGPHDTYGSDAATRIGDCYFYSKDYRTAVVAYERKLADYPNPDDIYPYYMAAVASGLVGDARSKVRFLENAKNASPSAPYYSEAMYELGRAYVGVGDDDDAIRALKVLRGTSPDKTYQARAMIDLGMIHRNRGEYDQALGCYKQVISELPGSEYAENSLLAIESIYQAKEDPDGYLDYIAALGDAASRTEEQKETVYFNTAEQMLLSGNWSKALSTLRNYKELYPDGAHSGQADYYMAECCRNLGKLDLACDYYKKAVSAPNSTSYIEPALLGYGNLSYSLGKHKDAYGAYSSLLSVAKLDANKRNSRLGMMRSAYRGRMFKEAVKAADAVKTVFSTEPDLLREADYVKAKSCLASSQRDAAFRILGKLSADPSTPEGAEAAYLVIQDLYDQGQFESIEKKVYDFSSGAGGQNYWLAKAFIVLGDSFVEKDNIAQARATFQSIRDGYTPVPGTDDDVQDQVAMRLSKLDKMQ